MIFSQSCDVFCPYGRDTQDAAYSGQDNLKTLAVKHLPAQCRHAPRRTQDAAKAPYDECSFPEWQGLSCGGHDALSCLLADQVH